MISRMVWAMFWRAISLSSTLSTLVPPPATCCSADVNG
jgi:hypothetical protein